MHSAVVTEHDKLDSDVILNTINRLMDRLGYFVSDE